MKYCPVTGEKRPNEENFCADCGAPLVLEKPKSNPYKDGVPCCISVQIGEKTVCPHCNKMIMVSNKAFYCHFCGHSFINIWPYESIRSKSG
ncbi:hypothetical protein A2V49_00530 [candidate division WWE3 bacterium RBG_19FT_COMBO_34_6]|uniref:Uncharacterized protein n=1 Tax=candidate division WWE3 bacterium RBG_19FT_COMBO_34_6 TaxID=1802612 RepID=A0A1F4UP12_UNCKA|nr:MAG: hypothetical protein A2V49_00530 [candidate division WWE3 bacterium RBG_19FT_COMBO_34_6]